MSTYVLVHGAWHGSWCWKRVRRKLRELGHEVFTPTLTGVGERSHLLSPAIDLEAHVEDVVGLLRWEDLSNVVLCGHSYGGCVVTGVADRVPERIGALVYLDAFVPQDGQSLHDLLPLEARQAQAEAAVRFGEGWKVPPIPAGDFNVNPDDRSWVDEQCTFQPLATFQQRLRRSGAADRIGDISYVAATDFEMSPFRPFAELARSRGWRTTDLPCGHDVMLDMPDALVDLLVEAGKRVRPAEIEANPIGKL